MAYRLHVRLINRALSVCRERGSLAKHSFQINERTIISQLIPLLPWEVPTLDPRAHSLCLCTYNMVDGHRTCSMALELPLRP